MINFSGKTALITGGTRGIGKSIAALLSDLKCHVLFTGTRANAIVRKGQTYIQLDLSDNASVQRFFIQLKRMARIDILINNAGINVIESIDKLDEENWKKILNVNLTGPMLIIREVANNMKKNKIKGKILNISSIFGVVSRERRDSYSASKAGLIGLTKAAALDLASFNILVNALCPGFTLTDLTRSILTKNEIKQLCSEIPLGRLATEEEIAKTAVFLCSDINTYITGQTIIVDGGYTVR